MYAPRETNKSVNGGGDFYPFSTPRAHSAFLAKRTAQNRSSINIPMNKFHLQLGDKLTTNR